MKNLIIFSTLLAFCLSCKNETPLSILIKNGTIYDGSGGKPFLGDVLIQGDTIAAVEKAGILKGTSEIDAKGMAVAPGFINMLSWATH
jgi:N-acyl-D-amino-acid deacylase